MDILSISKIGLGTILGVALGVFLRFFIIKVLVIIGVPVAILFFLDYSRFYKVNWLLMNEKWQVYVIPPVNSMYCYFNHHVLIGIIPGMLIGFSMGFLFNRKFLY